MAKAKRKKSGATSSPGTGFADFNKVDRVIGKHFAKLRKRGVLSVRPGYKFTGGWITNKPSVVVYVNRKLNKVAPRDLVPPNLGGIATDVRQASAIHKIRLANPARYATLKATGRPEFVQPEFPQERFINSGKRVTTSTPKPAVAKAIGSKTNVPYAPPNGANLNAVSATMTLICHASPDAGWPTLSAFLQGTKAHLTVGMYDFTAPHIEKALEADLAAGNTSLDLVLDHPAAQARREQTIDQTESGLKAKLGKRQTFAWALDKSDPEVSAWIFPSAYHIKVAVRDSTSFWLSSGNWNSTNQPPIDPLKDPAMSAAIAKTSDRDWHVIVKGPQLAKTFEAYLKNDLAVAAKHQGASVANSAVLHKAKAVPSPAKQMFPTTTPSKYFPPLTITNKQIKIQPILTPDTGAGNYVDNILALLSSAKRSLYMQTQYVHPSATPGSDPQFEKLMTAIKGRMDAGVDVRIIVSEYESIPSWLELEKAFGWNMSLVKIQQGVHNKGIVVDSAIVVVGSQNWSGQGVQANRDASLIIYDQEVAQYFEQIFMHDWTIMARQTLPKLKR